MKNRDRKKEEEEEEEEEEREGQMESFNNLRARNQISGVRGHETKFQQLEGRKCISKTKN